MWPSSSIILPARVAGDLCVCSDCVECQGRMFDCCDVKHRQCCCFSTSTCYSALVNSIMSCSYSHQRAATVRLSYLSPYVPKTGGVFLNVIWREAAVPFWSPGDISLIYIFHLLPHFFLSLWLTNTKYNQWWCYWIEAPSVCSRELRIISRFYALPIVIFNLLICPIKKKTLNCETFPLQFFRAQFNICKYYVLSTQQSHIASHQCNTYNNKM